MQISKAPDFLFLYDNFLIQMIYKSSYKTLINHLLKLMRDLHHPLKRSEHFHSTCKSKMKEPGRRSKGRSTFKMVIRHGAASSL